MFSYETGDRRIHQITMPTPFPVGPVNVILAEQPDGLILFDGGMDTDEAWRILLNSLSSMGAVLQDLRAVVLTHHHVDHIGLVNRLKKHCDVPVMVHPLAVPRLTRDRDFLRSRVAFFERMYREMGCGELGKWRVERMKSDMLANQDQMLETDFVLLDGDANPSELRGWTRIETPGHAPDHLVFYDEQGSCLISGDHLLPTISTNALVEPDANGDRMATYVQYRESLLKCREIPAKIVFPGHGNEYEQHLSIIDQRISQMDDKANRIESHLKAGPKTPFELAKLVYPHLYEPQFHLVISRIIGTLDYLELEGRVAKEMLRNTYYYSATPSPA